MTPKQQKCYNFVKEYWERNGVAPTYGEIAEHLGVKHRSTVNRVVVSMAKRGLLHYNPGMARSVRPAGMAWPPA